MKRTPTKKNAASDDIQSEYRFDYSKARANRFAKDTRAGAITVLLEPDVARIFRSADAVNSVLRALLATMPDRQGAETK